MRTIQEIRDLQKYLVEDYHGARLKEQKEDQSFIDGSFVASLHKENRDELYRPSTAARMVLKPASFLTTTNPQAFRYPRKKGETESALKVSLMLNNYIQYLKRQSVNPFSQHPKVNIKRGEAWLRIRLNPDWRASTGNQYGLPCWVSVPDPMIIFGSSTEQDGIPEEVIVYYERTVSSIKSEFPQFNATGNEKKVFWLEYWNAEQRYFEAKEQVLSDGENPYKFVPFVHCYSGWGGESPDSKPEDMAVSGIRYYRDLLIDEAETRSDLKSGIHRHVFRPIVLQERVASMEGSAKKAEPIEFNLGAYQGTVIPANLEWQDIPSFMPPVEAFQYYYNIKQEIAEVMSPVFQMGFVGETGRQTDMAKTNALLPYETILNGASNAFTTAFCMFLRLLDTIPDMLPLKVQTLQSGEDGTRKEETINKDDIGSYYGCEVKFEADDSLQRERKARLYLEGLKSGIIDAETCLIEGFGRTQANAKEIITKVIIDRATLNNPQFVQMMGLQWAKEAGLLQQFAELMQTGQTQTPAQQPKARESEVETREGAEMIDMAMSQRPTRNPPGLGVA